MKISLTPKFNVNYRVGQTMFCFKSDSLLSNGIVFFTNMSYPNLQRFSHCGIVTGKEEITEMTADGCIKSNLLKYTEDPKCEVSFKEPELLEKMGTDYLLKNIEMDRGIKKYDYKLFIGNIIAKIFPEKYRDYILERFNAKDRYICSEAVFRWYWNCLLIKTIFYKPLCEWNPSNLFHAKFWKPWRSEPKVSWKND
jgi:hypothetical protein